MRFVRWMVTASLLAGWFVVAGPVFGQDQSQESVAEAARKARAKKRPPAKPEKVYTNDELTKPPEGGARPTEGTPAQPAAGDAAAGSSEQAGAEAAGGAGEKKDEMYWRKRFRDARDHLARAEKELNILQRESEKGQVQYYTDPSKAMHEQYDRKQVNERFAKIDAKKKEIQQAKQNIDSLEDELRRAGGDPGWAR